MEVNKFVENVAPAVHTPAMLCPQSYSITSINGIFIF